MIEAEVLEAVIRDLVADHVELDGDHQRHLASDGTMLRRTLATHGHSIQLH
ncbi:MAG: hypothetical protein R3C10_13585 [Pirellulales bacterium]